MVVLFQNFDELCPDGGSEGYKEYQDAAAPSSQYVAPPAHAAGLSQKGGDDFGGGAMTDGAVGGDADPYQ